jgi:poly(A) polymerase Pap1
MKIPETNKKLKKKRRLQISVNKAELVTRLENYTEVTAHTIKVKVPQLKQKELETQTEPYTFGPPSAPPPSGMSNS